MLPTDRDGMIKIAQKLKLYPVVLEHFDWHGIRDKKSMDYEVFSMLNIALGCFLPHLDPIVITTHIIMNIRLNWF